VGRGPAGAGGVQPLSRTWHLRQVLDDPAGDRDLALVAEVDLAASDAAGEAVVRPIAVGRL
ncbi:MAG TPA: DUF3516 domain-containing protein, partial [Acidimicrobiales bacterium]|jgi:hypothetical protein|nr:DUF3516 domain-containing protein [Acidimicrobiales bacterium]